MPRPAAAALLLAALAISHRAAAERVAVLTPARQDVGAEPGRDLAAAVRLELAVLGLEVAATSGVEAAEGEIAANRCAEADCARRVALAVGAHGAIAVRLERTGDRPTITLLWIPVRDDDEGLRVSRPAPASSSVRELRSLAREAARELGGRLLSGMGQPQPSRPSRDRRPLAAEPRRAASPRALGAIGWTTFGSGLALVGAGTALVALDGGCATDDQPTVRGERYCATVYSTEEGGAALLAVAGAVITAAIALIVVSVRRRHGHDAARRF